MNLGMVFTATDLASSTVSRLGQNFMRFDQAVAGSHQNFMKYTAAFGVGVAAIHAGLKTLAIPAAFVKEAATIQDIMYQVKSVSGLASTEIEQMRKNFLVLSADLPVSAQALAEVAVSAAQLGIQGRGDIEKFSVSAIKLSKVLPELSTDAAGLALAQLSNVLDVPIDKLDNLSSAMVKMKTTSTATGTDIVDAARRFGAFAVKMGFSADQVIAFSAAFRDAGVSAEVGATAVQQVFTRMSTKTEDFAKIMGMTSGDLQKMMAKDMPGAVGTFIDALGKVEATKVPGILKELQLSGARTIPVILGLTKEKVKLAEKLRDASGAYQEGTLMQERFMDLTKSLNAQLDTLAGSVQNVFIALGQPLLEPATNSIKMVLNVLNPFLKALQEVPGLAEGISKGLLAFGATLLTGGLIVAIVSATALIQTAMGFMGLSVMGILGGVGAAFLAVIPYVAAAAAVISLFVLAWNNDFAGLKTFILESFDAIQLAFQATVALFSGGQLGSALQQQLAGIGLDGFFSKLISIRDTVVSFFQGFGDGFNAVINGTPVMNQLEGAVKALAGAVIDLFKGFGQILQSLGLMKSVSETAFGGASDQGFQFGSAITSVVIPAITLIIKVITGVINAANFLIGAFNKVNDFFGGGLLSTIITVFTLGAKVINPWIAIPLLIITHWKTLVAIFQGAGDIIGNVFGAVSDFIAMIPNYFDAGVTAVKNFIGSIVNVGKSMLDFIKQIPGFILNQFLNIPAYIVAGLVGIAIVFFAGLSVLWDITKTVVSAIGQFFWELPGVILSVVQAVVQFFWELPGHIWNVALAAFNYVKIGFMFIVNLAMSVVTAVVMFFWNLPGQLLSIATAAVMGMINMFMGFVSAIGGIVASVVGFFLDLPGKLIEIGTRAAKGLINALVAGIKDQASRIKTEVTNMVGALRGLLPGSDAKYGPLSDLTYSGSMLPATFAKGIELRMNDPALMMAKAVQPMSDLMNLRTPENRRGPLSNQGRLRPADMVPPVRIADAGQQNIMVQAPAMQSQQSDGQPILVQLMLDREVLAQTLLDLRDNRHRRGYNA